MRDNKENLTVSDVLKLLEEYPERAAEIPADFADNPNIEQYANAFLHCAMETLIQTFIYRPSRL